MKNDIIEKKEIEKLKENEQEIKKVIQDKKEKLKNKFIIEEPIVKITFTRLLAYFIIYSFLGFIIETLFGILTKGVVESRQNCLYGPFCCIYGLGAAIMIPGLQKFKKSNWALFLAGAIEGSVIEYFISLIGEVIFHIKWWDYSNMPFNIQGRICLIFTIFWGLLALGLIRFINPYIERIIEKIPKKIFKPITITIIVIIIINILFTSFGLKVFYTRLAKEHDLQLKEKDAITLKEEVLENEVVKYLSEHVFTDEKILKTFPNIKYEDKNGKIVSVKDILPHIQPYYFKITDIIK